MKRMGERNAGNPHVAFDAEGAGNVAQPTYFGLAGAPVLDPTCERLGVKFPGPTRLVSVLSGPSWANARAKASRSASLCDIVFLFKPPGGRPPRRSPGAAPRGMITIFTIFWGMHITRDARMNEAFDRIEALLARTTARSDRIREMLQSISEHIPTAPAASAFWEEDHPCPMSSATSTSRP
jgi:hypothetical protein